jgi:hypothetical protein
MNLRITKLSNKNNKNELNKLMEFYIFALVYENENARVYSLKLPFKYLLVITIKKN